MTNKNEKDSKINKFNKSKNNPKIFGIDGCKGGWFLVTKTNGIMDGKIFDTFNVLMDNVEKNSKIFIDIPIGLPDRQKPIRECDSIARKLLGRRHVTVFSPPCRLALSKKNYAEASLENDEELNRKLTIQSWGICQKIKEVDDYIQNSKNKYIYIFEVHPEICFLKMNKNQPVLEPKHRENGIKKRLQLLGKIEPEIEEFYGRMLKTYKRKILAKDDILDATAAFLTGAKSPNNLGSIPSYCSHDSLGIPMKIFFHQFN